MADVDCTNLSAVMCAPPNPASAVAAPDSQRSDPTTAGTPAVQTSFGELLRALNPLQHLPVIGTIYRAITGDTIQPAYRIAGALVGGLISGGPFGLLGTIAGCFAEEMHRIGWNMPDPATPPSGMAGPDAGIAQAATADARSIVPDPRGAVAYAKAAAEPGVSATRVDASAAAANRATGDAAVSAAPEAPFTARLMAGMAAYQWVEARGSG